MTLKLQKKISVFNTDAFERQLNKVLVPSSGDTEAALMFVGEAPGYHEAKNGQPFWYYASAGKMFTDCCNTAHINRSKCYITNLVKYKPYKNDFTVYYKDKTGTVKHRVPTEALRLQMEVLRLEIETVNPNVIVALGRHALYALTGMTSSHKYRGSILPCTLAPGKKVVATIHPQAVQYQYTMKTMLELDLMKAKRESQFPELKLPQRNLIIKPTMEQVHDYLNEIERTRYCAFDIENDRTRRLVDCIGLSADPAGLSAICIPFFYMGREHYQADTPDKDIVNYWSVQDEIVIWKRLDQIFRNPFIKKDAQNVLYDWSYLAGEHGLKFKNVSFDPMLAHHNCYAELPKNLGFMVSIYTDEPYFKDDQRTKKHLGVSKSRWGYNCKDVAVLPELRNELSTELIEQCVEKPFKFDMAMLEPLVYMTLQGLRVNTDLRDKLTKQYKEEYGWDESVSPSKKQHHIGSREQEFYDRIGKEINVLSPKQVQDWIYNDLGYKEKRSRKTGNVTADKDAIMKLYYEHGGENLKEIIHLRQGKDFLSDVCMAKLDPKTNRLHCSFNWTETFRLSSSSSPFEVGRNLMNVPKNDARRMVIPNPGMELGAADLERAEAHVVAFLVKDELILDLIAKGGDMHSHRAAMMYNIPIAEVTKLQRDPAKAGVHAVHYDVGWMTFLDIVNKGREEPMNLVQGKVLFNLILTKIPTAKRYQEMITEEIINSRTLWNLTGRRRTFYDRLYNYTPRGEAKLNKQMLREAFAWIPQSTVPDVTNRGLKTVYYKHHKYVNILMQIHDELLFEYKPENRQIAHEIVHEAMSQRLYYQGRSMMMGVEHSHGDNWLELEDFKL